MKYRALKFLGYLWLGAGTAGLIVNYTQGDEVGTVWSFGMLVMGSFVLAWEYT